MKKLVKKIKVSTTLELVTGLHIGGSSENVEIGGIDNPVIKIAVKDNQPYIPGSSIKGKMRCLLEQIAGSPEVGGGKLSKKDKEEGKTKTSEQIKINNLFGYSEDNQPSKLIVRDAYLTDDSAKQLRNCDSLDMPYTEAKWENVIDRVKGTAEHPRQTERIPAGVSFDVEFVINAWDDDNDGKALCELLEKGIKALENDYLGGSGSRGYGQIKFSELKQEEISFEKYFDHA
ncbi:MAG: type III-A CRISPR-associated RAMP protein Csm3 [Culturomica sp.]|jgi:CRISPR-associated protein Csm3|nr:type III-A CRISPR-associated RAMP protein Csm3 [Culturomica sp.]